MRFSLKPRLSKHIGTEAGTVEYVGKDRSHEVSITAIHYNQTHAEKVEISHLPDCVNFKEKEGVLWLNIDGVHNSEVVNKIGEMFDLHSLLLEDVVNTTQRPKLDEYDEHVFVVLKMLDYNHEAKHVTNEQVSLILGENYVISFQEDIKGDIFDMIRNRILTGKTKIRRYGADYLFYSLIDAIVDEYFIITDHLGERVDELEEKQVNHVNDKTIPDRYYHLKQQMLNFRKTISPMREVINVLYHGSEEKISPETSLYFRDVYDHMNQVLETIDLYRDTLAGLHDGYLSALSLKMNDVMKFLTVFSTLFIPLTFIVGLYGMNFKYMPELSWHFGYPAVCIVMAVVSLAMLGYFKHKKWI